MAGMYADSFVVDNDYKRIETTGKKALNKKTALYIKPEFLENIGSQRTHDQVRHPIHLLMHCTLCLPAELYNQLRQEYPLPER
jgi:hypothetical protein